MQLLRASRKVIARNRSMYLVLNIAVYGTLVMAMIVTAFVPGLHEVGLGNVEAFLDSPGSRWVVEAYAGGGVVGPALATLLGNLLFAALATTTLPSLVIPCFGVVATLGRAVFIGMPYAPTSTDDLITIALVSPVLVIEFQAYVLAMLGSVVLWRSVLEHRRDRSSSIWDGYLAGILENLRLYPAIVVLLVGVAALEAVTALVLH